MRRLFRISWTIKQTNVETLQNAVLPSVMATIRNKKKSTGMFGHFSKKKWFVVTLIDAVEKKKTGGRGSRVRQRSINIDGLNAFTTDRRMSKNELIHLGDNR